MKKTKLVFTAALALGLLFCVNDATAQQAVKKANIQKTVQTQTNQENKPHNVKAKSYTYKGKKILQISTIPMDASSIAPKPAIIKRQRQD